MPEKEKILVHETTYRGRGPAALLHRSRLQAVRRLFEAHVNADHRTWADFGCSNGFIIDEIVRAQLHSFSRISGFDHSQELLALARNKNVANAEFHTADLNHVQQPQQQFDVVTCFETLEHVGHLGNAFENLFAHTRPGGLLMLTVPNETSLPGVTKLWARMLLRRTAYDDFFDGQGFWRYHTAVLFNRRIDGFRRPGLPGYGPHLGFDYRGLRDIIHHDYLAAGRLRLVEERFGALRMGVSYVLNRPAPA